MTYAPRWRAALVLGFLSASLPSACISKGDTEITNNSSGTKKHDEPDSAASEPPTNIGEPPVDGGDENSAPSSTDESNDTDDDATDDDSDVVTDEEQSTEEPTTEPDETTSEPDTSTTPDDDTDTEPSDEPSDETSGEDTDSEPDAGAPAPQPVTELCSAVSGRPVLGESVLISDGDTNDKTRFSVAAGPGEHFVAWISPSQQKLVYTVVDGDDVAEPTSLPIAGVTDTLQPYVAAVYSAEAATGAGAYAVTWRQFGPAREWSVGFNWVNDGGWVEEEAETYYPGLDTSYQVDLSIAYDGSNYAIDPMAQHPYAIAVSETGNGTLLSPSEVFTANIAWDGLSIGDDRFVTLGLYNNGSGGSNSPMLSVFNAKELTAEIHTVSDLFSGFTFTDQGGPPGPAGVQMIWDGTSIAVVYGGGAHGTGLHYALVDTLGAMVDLVDLTAANLTPLDVYYDDDAQIAYVLSTDGTDVYFMGVDETSLEVVVENHAIASGEEVTRGFLVWDETTERHRAYFSSKGRVRHDIYSSVIGCMPAE